MLSRCEYRTPNRVLQLGMIALAVANILNYMLQRKSGLPESIVDPVAGFFFGVAIATTLLGIYLRARVLRDKPRS
jgi:hypothetical protein